MSTRPKKSAIERATQFSAFAALVGLDDQMNQTARLVESKIELSEDESEILNRKIQILAHKLEENKECPKIKVSYFVPDPRKNGGAYVTKTGTVKCIDEIFFKIRFTDGAEIGVSDMLDFDIMEQDG